MSVSVGLANIRSCWTRTSALSSSIYIYASHRTTLVAAYAKKVGLGSGSMMKPGKSGVGAVPQKKRLEPETDAKKLVSYLCGGNILKEGEDPKLRDRSEYPDWLWTLRLDRKPVDLEDLPFDTWEYWRRLHKLNRKRNMVILQNKYKYHKF